MVTPAPPRPRTRVHMCLCERCWGVPEPSGAPTRFRLRNHDTRQQHRTTASPAAGGEPTHPLRRWGWSPWVNAPTAAVASGRRVAASSVPGAAGRSAAAVACVVKPDGSPSYHGEREGVGAHRLRSIETSASLVWECVRCGGRRPRTGPFEDEACGVGDD